MSSSGFPDWQRITQWFASPVDEATGVSLDGGDHVSGPFDLLSFASVIVAVKAVGGPVMVTVTQSVPGGPASLLVSSSFVVAAGNVVFEGLVLEAGTVSVRFHEAGAGTSIDYAIVPSNVNTNVAGSLLAQLGFQHNDTPIANETAADFEDSASLVWSVVDDPANGRVKITATAGGGVQHNGVAVATEPILDFIDSGSATLAVVDDPAGTRVKVTVTAKGMLGLTVVLNGTGSYTAPTGAANLDVEGIAGGGSGGGASNGAGQASAASGGGSGAYSRKRLSANIGTHTVAVGAGGARPGAGNIGGNTGGDTSFKDSTGVQVLLAKGGNGGSAGVATAAVFASAGSQGGVAASGVGDVVTEGLAAGDSFLLSTGVGIAGHGAPSVLGGNQRSRSAGDGSSAGLDALTYGAGGGGGLALASSTGGFNGGIGANGVLIIAAYT